MVVCAIVETTAISIIQSHPRSIATSDLDARAALCARIVCLGQTMYRASVGIKKKSRLQQQAASPTPCRGGDRCE